MSAVRGHALRHEGAPHGRNRDGEWERIGYWGGTGGQGHALCECGATSDLLGSSTQRKAWHREHKAHVVTA
jgi:hypothetical protein